MTTQYVPMVWHPWRNNPLDYIGAKLVTDDGRRVELTRSVRDFIVTVDGVEVLRTMNNDTTCSILAVYEVGLEV